MWDREKEQVAEERKPAIGTEPRRSCFIIMLAARRLRARYNFISKTEIPLIPLVVL